MSEQPLRVEYDPATDVLTVEDCKYSGHVFRYLATLRPGTVFQMVSRQDGIIAVRHLRVVDKEPQGG